MSLAASLESLAAALEASYLISPSDPVEPLEALADILEAKGEYTYDYENVKRWVLGPGGVSGNCEICVENSEMDWIADDDTFLDSDEGDIDGPPAHPHCECSLEYKEKRVRVYA